MQSLGLVIPTFNSGSSLSGLFSSIEDSGLLNQAAEVLLVNDGSQDNTFDVFETFRNQSRQPEKWKILNLPRNQGRFEARLKGAQEVHSDLVLFLDARVILPQDFSFQLLTALKSHNCLMAGIGLEPDASLYDLYWDRTHRWAFKKYFAELDKGFWLTDENYEEYTKGTGAFLCSRELFLQSCRKYEDQNLLSDDTLLMKDLCKKTKIYVPPHLKVLWRPRRQLGPFLARLFERGPGFVEYHIFQQRGLYFYIWMSALMAFALTLVLLIHAPAWGMSLLLGLCFLLLSSTLLFSRSSAEALRLSPLHFLSIASYFFGSLWGLFVVGLNSNRKSRQAET